MRDLHVVAVSEDGRHVLLGPSKTKPSHRVRLDARLVAAVRGELDKPTGELSPKEIQARLRAGESAERIAGSAGMALTRVERFAGPVAGEMARMIDEARDGFVVRGRLGTSAVALGKAVDAAILEHAKPDSVDWTTRREEDGRWRVQVSWFTRGKSREAAWWYEPHARSLEATDPASAALGHVDANPAPRRTAKKPAPAPAPAVKPKAATAPKPTATKAKAASAPKPAPAKKAPARKASAPAGRPRLQVVPDPPAAPRKRAAAKPTVAEERDGVKARASVPAWADVLLGTTPSNDH